jgi:hypothetical protein
MGITSPILVSAKQTSLAGLLAGFDELLETRPSLEMVSVHPHDLFIHVFYVGWLANSASSTPRRSRRHQRDRLE